MIEIACIKRTGNPCRCRRCSKAKNPAAVALGSLTSKKKARTSRANGKLGGRPKSVPLQSSPLEKH